MPLNGTHRRRKDFALSYLGDKCVKCGSIENLEVDHIDPKTKLKKRAIYAIGEELFLTELKKCQLLCSRCHWQKTRLERRAKREAKPLRHIYSTYANGKYKCRICKDAWSAYHRGELDK